MDIFYFVRVLRSVEVSIFTFGVVEVEQRLSTEGEGEAAPVV